VTRHEGSRFLDTFDFPNPAVTRGNRDTTNVPPQALALLNILSSSDSRSLGGSPYCAEKAQQWHWRLGFEFSRPRTIAG